jgi:hypothetical protein
LPDVSKEKMASFNNSAIDTATQRFVSKDRRLLERVIKKCIAANIPEWDTMPPTWAEMTGDLKVALACALQEPGLEFSLGQSETKWNYRITNRRKSRRRKIAQSCNDDTSDKDDDDEQGGDDGAGVWPLCGFVRALFNCFGALFNPFVVMLGARQEIREGRPAQETKGDSAQLYIF